MEKFSLHLQPQIYPFLLPSYSESKYLKYNDKELS